MEYAELKRELRGKVQERMDFLKDFTDAEVEDTIDEILLEQKLLAYPVETRRRLKQEGEFTRNCSIHCAGWIFCRYLWRTAPSRKL